MAPGLAASLPPSPLLLPLYHLWAGPAPCQQAGWCCNVLAFQLCFLETAERFVSRVLRFINLCEEAE